MNRLALFLKDKDKKSYPKIAKELVQLLILKRELPKHYLGKFLYRKDIANPEDYLSMKEFYQILYHPELHRSEYSTLLGNKLIFALLCEKYDIPAPKVLSHNLNGLFLYNEEKNELSEKAEICDFFEHVIRTSNADGIFLKPLGEMGGKNCHKLILDNTEKVVDALYPQIINAAFIHQELIKQHSAISAIYPHSINTLRLDSYIDNSGKIHILSALMRFGSGGAFIDNKTAGGLQVGINMETGTLKARATTKMKFGLPYLYEHPDTQFTFEGFEIPYFKESCDLVEQIVNYIPDRLTGWDVAITENGPQLIEGNDNPSIHMTDITSEGYLKNPIFKEILEMAKS